MNFLKRGVVLLILVLKAAHAGEMLPQRIIALQPSLAETAAWILEEEGRSKIVGVSDYSDTPSFLKNIQSIGSYARFSIEKVMSLKPDLVLVSPDGNPKDRVDRLKSLGVRVESYETQDFDGLISTIEKMSIHLKGNSKSTERFQAWKKKLDEVRRTVPKKTEATSRVLIQVGDSPMVVAGGKGFLIEALKLSGVESVFQDEKEAFLKPSLEAVLSRKPTAIWILQMGHDPKPYEKMKESWIKKISASDAFKGVPIRILSIDALVRPSPRLLDGILELRKFVLNEKN